jgi:hypothetical protein
MRALAVLPTGSLRERPVTSVDVRWHGLYPICTGAAPNLA